LERERQTKELELMLKLTMSNINWNLILYLFYRCSHNRYPNIITKMINEHEVMSVQTPEVHKRKYQLVTISTRIVIKYFVSRLLWVQLQQSRINQSGSWSSLVNVKAKWWQYFFGNALIADAKQKKLEIRWQSSYNNVWTELYINPTASARLNL